MSPRSKFSMVAVAAMIAAAAQVHAGTTRAQVEAELAEAIRTGNMMANGESGLTMRELYPGSYPAPAAAASTVSREQVGAELQDARRQGTTAIIGEAGMAPSDDSPKMAMGKTRAQVRAELAEAIRTGNMIANGESGLMLNQVNPDRYAKVMPSGQPVMSGAAADK
jgi:hypothetical protein